jgi:hypothetical protein
LHSGLVSDHFVQESIVRPERANQPLDPGEAREIAYIATFYMYIVFPIRVLLSDVLLHGPLRDGRL